MTVKIKHGKDFYMHEDATINQSAAAVCGDHVAIDKGFYCTTQLDIGDYVHIGPYVGVIGGPQSSLVMEDFSFMAIGTKVVAGSDDYSASNLMGPLIPEKFKKLILTTVRFEKFSGCGANCTILPGITLAQGSILCAGSLLNKDTKPWTIYAGNPARPISQRDKEKILAQAKYVREKEK